jgi:hypothetical protein
MHIHTCIYVHNTQEEAAAGLGWAPRMAMRGTQFTCFTGTKVQILTPPRSSRGGIKIALSLDKEMQNIQGK